MARLLPLAAPSSPRAGRSVGVPHPAPDRTARERPPHRAAGATLLGGPRRPAASAAAAAAAPDLTGRPGISHVARGFPFRPCRFKAPRSTCWGVAKW